MPHDLFIGDVYLPPLLAAAIVALVAATYTVKFMHRRELMTHFANPPLVFIALAVTYTVILGSTLFPT